MTAERASSDNYVVSREAPDAPTVHLTPEDFRRFRSEQITKYLRGVAPISFVAVPVMICLSVFTPSPAIRLVTVLLAITALLQYLAYRDALAGHVRRPVLLQSFGLWMVGIGVGLPGLPFFGVSAALAILPVIIAVPYVSPQILLRLVFIGTGIMGVNGVLILMGGVLTIGISETITDPFLMVGTTALTGCVCFSLWHTHNTLVGLKSLLSDVNNALRDSERSLERKVTERAAELELSRRNLEQARDDALSASRHKSAFLANMSHELRTPLNAVIGFSQALEDCLFGELNEKQEEYATHIRASGEHLLGLINDILDLSKIEAGRLELHCEALDLAATLDEAGIWASKKAETKGIELHKDWQSALVWADPVMLRRILEKLLSNAIKFTDAGSVTLGARPVGEFVEIRVSDTGVGIADEQRERIFEAFHSAHNAPGTASDGAGVGLALARQLVELHGGQISVESEISRGTTLRFTLSVSPPAGEMAA